jgi:hypothetical protein
MVMRDIIKKLLRESFLNEALADVDDDVNLIYDMFFKNDIDEIERTGIIKPNMFKTSLTTTGILRSPKCVEAHNLNPCRIHVNSMVHQTNNFYKPDDSLIGLSIHQEAFSLALDHKGNIFLAAKEIPETARKSFFNEFTEHKIKGTIHHELAHWLDDTLHSKHISNYLNKIFDLPDDKAREAKLLVNMKNFEIEGQIHNIKQAYDYYKRKFKETGDEKWNWDNLTIDDLIGNIVSLNNVNKIHKALDDVRNTNYRKKWRKDLLKRMHRENLLGDKMR